MCRVACKHFFGNDLFFKFSEFNVSTPKTGEEIKRQQNRR